MKQILLFASAIALMTSCAKKDVTPGSEANLPKGISFQAQIGDDTKAQWEEAEGKYNMFWYSEADRIDVFFQNAKLDATPSAAANTWNKDELGTYKATRSMSNGLFTAISDVATINFIRPAVPANKAAFFAIWPAGLTVDGVGTPVTSLKVNMPLLNAQDQTEVNGSSTIKNVFMYSEQTGVVPANEYEATADRLALKFVRPATALTFKIANYEKNATVYGDLQSIEITSLGKRDGVKPDGTPKYDGTTLSSLDYGAATFDSKTKEITVGTTATKVKLNINGGTGLTWKDNAIAYMAINPVKRTFTEGMEITYTFADVVITKIIETSSNWPAVAGNFVGVPTLDLDNEDYVITKDNKKLVVNKGTFKTAYDKAIAQATNKTTLTTIVSKVELTTDDMKLMKDLTSLVEVTLNANTEIPSKTFTQTALTKVSMPLVTKIADDAFGIQTALATLELGSYKFDNVKANTTLLIKGALKILDMSAVENTKLEFNSDALTLNGYTALDSVTVKNGLIVGANMFDGCTSLVKVKFPVGTVNGSVELGGNSIFNACAKLESISISNTVIPAGSFKGCTVLKTTLQNGVAKSKLQPTFVGAEAFQSCAALESIDLTVATTIGESAFDGAGLKDVMYVNELTTLEENAFANCTALKRITFAKVTKVGNDAFKGTTLDHLEFKMVISSSEKTTAPSGTTFGTTTNTKLFVPINQPGVVGNSLTLKSEDGKTQTPFAFSSIS